MLNVYSSMRVTKTGKRIRITRAEVEKAKQQLLEEGKKQAATGQKPTSIKPKHAKGFWRDGIYCDSYGRSWGLDENLNTLCLGKTEDALSAKKNKNTAKEIYSSHSKLRNGRPSVLHHSQKSIVATLKQDPYFLTLLDGLISQDKGIRSIRSELKIKGYEVPLRTLARWIRQQKEKEAKNRI